MLKAIFNGLVRFTSGFVVGTWFGVVLAEWIFGAFEFLDFTKIARIWNRFGKKKNAD